MIESTEFLPDAEATERLGGRLAATRPARAVVYLEGDLGAGKSSLARAMLRALGVTGTVRSPTYTLIERYPLSEGGLDAGEAVHLDLYRIADPEELDFLGLDALAAEAVLWLVEWPERGAGTLPAADLRIALDLEGAGRRIRLQPRSEAGRHWLERLERSGTDSAVS